MLELKFFPMRSCLNAESETTDRITQTRLAQIHSERAEINRFVVLEARQNWRKVQWKEAFFI